VKIFLDISLLKRNREFALLFSGQLISFMGTMITGVALPYQVYIETHSTLIVGFLSLIQLIPLLATALIGGVLADRYPRRYLLLGSELLQTVCCLLLALNACQSHPSIRVIFLFAFCLSALTGLHGPALESMVQQIVKREDFPLVGSFRSFKASMGMILGPAFGGLLIAHAGIVVTYLIDGLSFLASLLALWCMQPIPMPVECTKHSPWLAIKAGINYAFSRQVLVGSYLVDFFAMLFGMPSVLFPAMAIALGSVKYLGLFYSAPAVGAFLITLTSGWTGNIKYYGRAITFSAIFWGVAIIGFGLMTNLFLALLFLVLAGAFDALSSIFRNIMWNETIPHHMRGRLAGIEMISYTSGPKLGDTESGLVAHGFGITASIISGGLLCIISVVFCAYKLPEFWSYHSDRAKNIQLKEGL
jgi:MFS family permease